MAAFSLAAFVLCFALAGTTHIAAAFADKKAYNKGYRALRKGDFQAGRKDLSRTARQRCARRRSAPGFEFCPAEAEKFAGRLR